MILANYFDGFVERRCEMLRCYGFNLLLKRRLYSSCLKNGISRKLIRKKDNNRTGKCKLCENSVIYDRQNTFFTSRSLLFLRIKYTITKRLTIRQEIQSRIFIRDDAPSF